MPRTPIDYSNTSIYKICCKDLSISEIYVGHTTDMTKRKNQHKNCCNNENGKQYNMNVYQFIRKNGGWNNWDMIEVERFSAIDGNDAKKRERYWIETLNATLNSEIPSRTRKEHYIDNKEILKEKYKIYREENKQLINEKKKQYYENNKQLINEKITCECGCEVTKYHLKRHQQSKKHQDFLNTLN